MTIPTQYYYLLIMLTSILVPFLLSFDKKVHFYTNWKYLVKSIPIVATLFILGDILYTYLGVWGFNPTYHLPFTLGGLPIEEISFFIIVPYCCLFLYEVFKAYFPKLPTGTKPILIYLSAGLFLLIAILSNQQIYTNVTFLFSAAILLFIYRYFTRRFSLILLAFLVSCIPFFFVNGFLTGMYTEAPIVWYNDMENLGIRLISIPVEDFSYSFNLIALNIITYEFFKNK